MTTSAPLVSVLIATHNRADLVCEAIASVRRQTHPRIEIIVTDDGSSDGTVRRLAEMPDVQLLVAHERAGPGAARNSALACARGAFIAPLDSDDVWTPCFLERSIAALADHQLDFVFSNWTCEWGASSGLDLTLAHEGPGMLQTRSHAEWWILDPVIARRVFLRGCPAPSSSLVLRRESMPRGWNEQMLIGDDHYLLIDMVASGFDRVAFTCERRWTKRRDGQNRFDGVPIRDLEDKTSVDWRLLRRDFAKRLSGGERLAWEVRRLRLEYRRARRRVSDRCSS